MDAKMDIQALREKVARNTDVIKSAVELIKGFKAKLDECLAHEDDDDGDFGGDIQALSDELDAQTESLAAAIAENTGTVDAEDGEDDEGGVDGGGGGSEPVEPLPTEPVEDEEEPAEPAPTGGFEEPRE